MNYIPGLNLDFSQGVYSGTPSPSQSLEFPELYDVQTAWNAILNTSEGRLLHGINGELEPTYVDLDSESPHVLVSATTGAGKSATMRALLSQALRQGSVGTVLDYKRHSHVWAKGLPNVGYADSITQIGNALCELGREVHRRNGIVDKWLTERTPGDDRTPHNAPVGPRIVVLFEELNAVMTQLKTASRRIPNGTYTAMDALNDIVFMGRAAKVHVVASMQFPDFRVISQSLVENFGLRIMIDYTKNAWTKIAWDVGLPIAAPPQVGRAMAVKGGKARQVQLLYVTEDQAAAMAREPYERNRGNAVARSV